MTVADPAVLASLFAVAFLAATVFPAQSEALLATLLVTGEQPAALLVGVASVGNIAGSTCNWLIGRSVERFRERRWFPVDRRTLERAQAWYHRFGRWSLLASWVPVIGDPLTVAAGVMREPLRSFLLLVAVAKTSRYIVLAALTLHFM